MNTKKVLWAMSALLIVLALAATAIAVPAHKMGDVEQLARHFKDQVARLGSLDEDYNQMRYIKTTDFGATWTMAQAGDISTFAPTETGLPDFGAVTTAGGELCFVIVLNNAATPGVYSLTGPTFTPVLVMARGDNSFPYGYSSGEGYTDVARAPDGSLVCIIWGSNAAGQQTLWAAKSTNNGGAWGAPWVVVAEPTLPPYADNFGHFKMPERITNTHALALYQAPGEIGYDQFVVRFPTSPGGAGTVVPLNDYSGHPFSYMFGGCKPIAYDPANNYLYLVFRNQTPNGVSVYLSTNFGTSFSFGTNISYSPIRYPHVTMRPATQTPIVILAPTVGALQPGDEQCIQWTYDEFGYNGGSWTANAPIVCRTLFDENTGGYNSMYVPHVWWWNGTQGFMSVTGYTNFLAGEVILTSRTVDGGGTWSAVETQVHYIDDQINAGTMQIPQLCGHDNGTAYVAFCGAPGFTDEVAPSVSQMTLLSDPTTTGPYAVKAYYTDNVGIDNAGPQGPWVNWALPGEADTWVTADSMQVNANGVGWYFFTIPGGWTVGDTLNFYCDGYDLSGNYAATHVQIIRVGFEWLGVEDRPEATDNFRLLGNYPNPFNPTTRIEFTLPADLRVTMKVYNTLGQEVATLANNVMLARGLHTQTFDASALASGVYVYTLEAGSYFAAQKMVLMK